MKVDIKRELYYAKLKQEALSNTEIIEELKEAYINLSDELAQQIIRSLITKRINRNLEIEELLKSCIRVS